MKNRSLLTIGFFAFVIAIVFLTLMPQRPDDGKVPLSEFSTHRAFEHVQALSAQPHYVGSAAHQKVADYLISALRELGLEPIEQHGHSLTEWGNAVKSRNIMARLEGSGNGPALMLLSHYDSAPHSASKGA
ncbi:MAG TPA: peptidase M28, partial [Flavobacterium sp.]|nr:peptidase M28 [Flavobacterium sp.]